jgi:hypothetical protein
MCGQETIPSGSGLLGWHVEIKEPRSFETSAAINSASYWENAERYILGEKKPGREAARTSLYSVGVKNVWRYAFSAPYAFFVLRLIKQKDNLTSQKHNAQTLLT